ncbi:MAG TPA: hypothetical protein VEX38_02260, partial [Fimbriimonadaceae bacterium]|nr:hypothetical protein [Fimbriimonadaceae bacterium]
MLSRTSHTLCKFFSLLLLAGAAALSHASTEVIVKPKKGQTLEELARVVAPVGKLDRKDLQGSYRLKIREGLSYPEVARRLRGKVGMALPLGTPAPVNRGSTTGLQTQASAYLKEHPRKGGKARLGAPGWLEGHLWWLRDRAYPNTEIDDAAYRRAAARREEMAPAVIDRSSIGALSINGTWSFLGPRNLGLPYRIYGGLPPVNGRVNAIAFNANATAIYIGAPEGGVWKSTDNGVNWTPLADRWPFMQVSSIACDPVNPNIVYVGTGDFPGGRSPYGIGVMKSTDGGVTWSNSGFQEFQGLAISDILVDPDNPAVVTVYAGRATRKTAEIYRSTNSGQTWAKIQPAGIEAEWSDAEYGIRSPQGFRALYATGGQWGGLMMRSTDGGANWWLLLLPTDV